MIDHRRISRQLPCVHLLHVALGEAAAKTLGKKIVVEDKPGAFFHALEPFNRLRISMSKIESRPSKRKAWEYYFFVDVEGHASEPKLAGALRELEEHCTFVKILGTYPKSPAV